MRILCLVGRSGVGKTTLLERAVRALSEQGVSVLAVKSSHHAWDDREGSDSQRLAKAGASGAVFLGTNGAQFHLETPPSLPELLGWLAGRYQVALIEGGKSSPYPKVELLHDQAPLLDSSQTVGRLNRSSPNALDDLLDLLERYATPWGV